MEPRDPAPDNWQLLRIWATIGFQSFGGGASTTFLIQRAFTEKHTWLTLEEFIHFWSLCVLSPGINLLALTILIGKKLGGGWGIVASLAGLLLPSSIITCIFAAIFKQIDSLPAMQAIIKGIVPATGGIMLLLGLNLARPLFQKSYKEGIFSVLLSSVLIVLFALAVILGQLPAVVVIIGGALLGALFFSSQYRQTPMQKTGERE
jgi:chromate transporter